MASQFIICNSDQVEWDKVEKRRKQNRIAQRKHRRALKEQSSMSTSDTESRQSIGSKTKATDAKGGQEGSELVQKKSSSRHRSPSAFSTAVDSTDALDDTETSLFSSGQSNTGDSPVHGEQTWRFSHPTSPAQPVHTLQSLSGLSMAAGRPDGMQPANVGHIQQLMIPSSAVSAHHYQSSPYSPILHSGDVVRSPQSSEHRSNSSMVVDTRRSRPRSNNQYDAAQIQMDQALPSLGPLSHGLTSPVQSPFGGSLSLPQIYPMGLQDGHIPPPFAFNTVDHPSNNLASLMYPHPGHGEPAHALHGLGLAGQDVNSIDDMGRSALHHAARMGRIDQMQELLEKGAHVDMKDYQGWTPLQLAKRNGHEAAASFLVQWGA